MNYCLCSRPKVHRFFGERASSAREGEAIVSAGYCRPTPRVRVTRAPGGLFAAPCSKATVPHLPLPSHAWLLPLLPISTVLSRLYGRTSGHEAEDEEEEEEEEGDDDDDDEEGRGRHGYTGLSLILSPCTERDSRPAVRIVHAVN